ncbi:sodium-dependent multivitamin transporter-like isoform X2 [Acanthaster planci]|uniref:Sodium-dependent multivitamin transporter-like isoform X2 n=1 Tax=Acanthaster planci TaxID=133434 RepID=A0A8B7XVP7_ACAPL|nr:sodium-dependent multivitamin transporter-like isoform X2 [Acanthaster planci]
MLKLFRRIIVAFVIVVLVGLYFKHVDKTAPGSVKQPAARRERGVAGKMSGAEPNVHPFTWLDYVIFSAMLAVSACTGLYHACAGEGQKSTSKFLMADRSMMSLPVAISVIASYLSAITILGVPSEVFVYGIQYWMVCWSFFIAIPVSALVFIPVFHGLGLTSAYDYLHKRFSPLVRSIGALFFILQTLLYLAVVLYAPALALEAATKFPIFATVLTTGILCTIYTALGGIKAVIWTDVFQFIVLFGSLLTITIMGVIQAGGMKYVWTYNNDRGHLNFFNFSPDPTERLTFWGLIIGGVFNTLPVWAVSQTSVQRFLTAKNLKEAKRSVWFGLPGTVFVLTLVGLIGLVLFAYYNNLETSLVLANSTATTPVMKNDGPQPHYTPNYQSSDQILVYFVSLEFGNIPGIQGLFVACLFAGTLSTVSSGLNALAAVTLMDVVRPWRGPPKQRADSDASQEGSTNTANSATTSASTPLTSVAVNQAQDRWDTIISKILTAVFGVISIGLAFLASKLGSLVKTANTVVGGVGGPLLGVFSLGMLYRRANTGGALIGILVGFYLALWMTIGAATHQDENGNIKEDAFALYRVSFMWYSMFTSMATFLVGVIVSEIIRCCIPDERYKRVDPLLLATFLRPKGWHKSFPGTDSHNPDMRIGDPVFQSLLASGNQSVDQENESLLGDLEGNDIHELGRDQDKPSS